MATGLASAPVVLPASLSAPVSSGLDDLFDLGGGVGMPTGGFVPPKAVSKTGLTLIPSVHFKFSCVLRRISIVELL